MCSAFLVVMALPAAAAAQRAEEVPSDPDTDSPSGAIYELPLDRARDDAAPRKVVTKNGAQRRAAAPQPSGDSPIRSENNFGSSSQVPGVDDQPGAVIPGGEDGVAGVGRRGGAFGERGGAPSGRASDGAGRSAAVDDARGALADSDAGALSTAAANQGGDGPSGPLVLLLVALTMTVGVTVGTLAARSRRG